MGRIMEHHLVYLPLSVARKIGSKTYVTDSCKKGHYVGRIVSHRGCIQCKKESNKLHMRGKYRDKSYRDALHEARRERYATDSEYRERVLDQCKKYREENADAHRERARKYARENRISGCARKKKWYEQNREHVFSYQKQYEQQNPEKCKAWKAESSRSRRHRRPTVKSELDQFVLEECYDLAAKRTEQFGFEWQVDHMIPLQGINASGLHVWRNFQVIPAWLNYAKKNKMLYTEPMQWLSPAIKGKL